MAEACSTSIGPTAACRQWQKTSRDGPGADQEVIDGAFYDRISAWWRFEQTRLLREIERHGEAEESYTEDGMRLLALARNTRQLFARQAPREKKRLLSLVPVEL
ncbi:MAG: hypothetical protein E5V44_05980, partial [Mesorhizobium sp.]